jgi:phosphoenolpyruvate-protein kinase (PTS system EI component)
MADVLAQEADFLSIGTNDLTQYALAMDRGHPKLARMADALHPAVLRLIHATVEAAHKHGKWAGICGGIASDVSAVPVLIGLGLDELSVSIQGIPSVKAAIRALSMERCVSIARDALEMKTSGEVRSYLAEIASQAQNMEGAIAQ